MIAFPKSYIVWDLETTGLDPITGHIVEVAAVRVANGEIVETYTAILNNGVDIPVEASNVHHITREKCEAEGIDPKEALDKLMAMLNGAEANVTHNGQRFDIPFLAQVTLRLGVGGLSAEEHRNFFEKVWSRSIDTAVIMKAKKLGLVRAWNESFVDFATRVMSIKAFGVKYNVSVCCDDLGIDRSNATLHRAGGDVDLTNEIYKALCLKDHV